ncbi:MAG TPA: diacylglycerol kinase family protein [Isosphaeraceae bacterium]
MTQRGADAGAGAGAGSGRPPWVGIAANAHSGVGTGRKRVERLVRALGRLGLDARVAWTPSERTALVAGARGDPSCRCLVAAGGDGTVAALINEEPATPVTVLPAGTENLFARHFGLDRRPERLAATIAAGRVVPIDLGRAGTQRFALMAGIGFDADVVSRHHSARVDPGGRMRPTHRAFYVESVLRSSWKYRFPPLSVTVADPGGEPAETIVGTSLFVFNLPRYALGLPLAPSARCDDGLLDLLVFRDAGALRALHYLGMAVLGLHLHMAGVTHRRVRRVFVSAATPVPVQLDGDPGGWLGATAWSAEVLPGALEVLVPEDFSAADPDPDPAPARIAAHH